MKKRLFVAFLMCMTMSVTACGSENNEEEIKKEAVVKQEETTVEEETAAEENTEEAKAVKEETKQAEYEQTRLVSVKNTEKYVTIGEYKGLTLDKTVMEVTEEDIDYELEYITEEVDGPAEEGDAVTINFTGTKDGVAFDGGTADNYELVLGDGLMIEGFEEGIVGMNKGETKDLNLTFPENYGVEDLNGQAVVFRITLQKIERTPELTDEWIAANTDVKTVNEYRQKIREKLEIQAEENAVNELRSIAWNAVLETSEVKEYPEKDIEEASAEYRNLYSQFLEEANISLEEFVESQGFTMEEFEEECQMYAEMKVEQNLIVQGIMDAEGLSIEDPECLEYQDMMIAEYGAADLADLIDQYGQVAVDETIGLLRVEDFIIANATINDLVTNGEMVGEDADIEEGIDTGDSEDVEKTEELMEEEAAEEE